MRNLLVLSAFVALLLTGAVFGFFYAWVCSTMWGLDAADPRTAIAAMQAMNASVRNAVFAPAFFLTPVALVITAALAWRAKQGPAAAAFSAAGLIYLFGGMLLTMTVNVPMNETLALVAIPDDPAEAAQIWRDYSGPWQFWNQTRTVFSGLALGLAGYGLYRLGQRRDGPQTTATA